MLQHRVSFLALTVALLGAPLENGYAAGPVAPVSKQIQVTTLKQALEYAYSNNATLEATRAGLRATDEELPQATAGWKPRLSASISQTAQRSRVDQGNAVASYSNPLQASITLRQSLYAGGSTVAATRKAKSDIMAGQYGLIGAEQETLFSGVDIYATIKQSEHILEAAQKNESVLLKTVELAEAKHAAGEASITDVMSAKGDYATAIANKEDAERDVVIAKATFLQRTGVMPGALK